LGYQKYQTSIYYRSGADNFHNVSFNSITNEIIKIVEKEGPIHIDIIKKRIANIYKVRLGSRVVERIEQAIHYAEYKNSIIEKENFYLSPTIKKVFLRHHINNQEKRSIEEIPSIEIQLAVIYITKNSLSISEDDLIKETARLFGLRATSEVSYVIRSILRNMVVQKKINNSRRKYQLS
jgi:hypothetical protein